MKNPLILAAQTKTFSTSDDAVPFGDIQTEHFLPAIESGIREARLAIAEIASSTAPPSFENVIAALESSSEGLDLARAIYFNLFHAEASPELQRLAQEISPLLAAFSSELFLNAQLFAKVSAVYQQSQDPKLGKLSPERHRLATKYYQDFVRNGALLNETQKAELRRIDQELSVLSPKFSKNLLDATNAFELVLSQPEELKGLPESVIAAAALDAKRAGFEGKWRFTLQAPSIGPFLEYSQQRHLREKIWRASSSRAFGGAFDNQEVILTTLRLRFERAQLLGFESHAEFVLQERMAHSPERVNQFLRDLLVAAQPAAQRDIQEVREFAKNIDGLSDLKPWDFALYSRKLREKKFNIDQEKLRPYFPLQQVLQGAFEHGRRLFGLNFVPRTDIPVYHPDVSVFEVRDSKSDRYVGLFYCDFFPRATKKSGAWCSGLRNQGMFWGKSRRPHVSIVCNFTPPTEDRPSLLDLHEVRTLFHEFGHALHELLSQCEFRSLAGTSVYWDFVELPSQIMENWVRKPEGLSIFAKHFQTGEPLPVAEVAKIEAAEQFQSGYSCLRQIQFASLDMAWHTANPKEIRSVVDFEDAAVAKFRAFPKEEGTNSSCSFAHIFAGGYDSGYYSYKWAEVLDADAFELFEEKGIFNPEVSMKFRSEVLEKGGSEDPMELYRRFRGREPDTQALLRRDGFIR